MKKNALTRTMAVALASIMLAGCGSAPIGSSGSQEADSTTTEGTTVEAGKDSAVTLEVEYNGGGGELDCLREIMEGFTTETGIGIELITPGTDYESVMKTRMASGDMPDVFVTHGWSVLRYGDFLYPVNDQPWVKTYDASIVPVITDSENGNIYINGLSMNVGGIYYNKAVLDEAGVDPMSIKTTNDLLAACEKIKSTGVTPFHLGGKEAWPLGGLVNLFGPAFFTAEGCAYPNADKLKDGTFDWNTDGKPLFDFVKEMINNGYFNEDILTAGSDSEYEAFSNGQCAFSLNGNFTQFRAFNPDVQAGIIAIPNSKEGGQVYMSVGEGNGDAWGVWKDSEYVEEGLELLAYLAKPEVTTKWLGVTKASPAHTDVSAAEDNEGYFAREEFVNNHEGEICYENIFDRNYLPSGMWGVLTDSLSILFSDPSDQGEADALANMQNNFVEKYATAQEE